MLLKQRVPVAQPDRVLGYEPRDRGFESLQARHKQSSDGSAVFLRSHGFSTERTAHRGAAAAPCMLYFHAHSWRGCQYAWESECPRVRQIGQARGDCAIYPTPICGALRLARREEVRIQPRVRRISKRAAVVPCALLNSGDYSHPCVRWMGQPHDGCAMYPTPICDLTSAGKTRGSQSAPASGG